MASIERGNSASVLLQCDMEDRGGERGGGGGGGVGWWGPCAAFAF